MSSELIAESAIRHAITSVMHAVDAKRWDELRPYFADTVITDYTSLFGGQPREQRPEAIISGWRELLGPVDATQHLLGPITVQLSPAAAVAECHLRAYHVAAGCPGGGEWLLAGHYFFTLEPGSWRIRGITLQAYYQTGNRDLLQEAGRRR